MANNDQMDMRDIFAMAAMQGLLASKETDPWLVSSDSVASSSYKIADAMLAERAKRMENGHE